MTTTADAPVALVDEPPTRRRRRSGRGQLIVGGAIVAGFVLVAILAPLIAPYDPLAQDVANALAPPSPAHLLGTDELGRDAFSRVVYAARVDLPVSLIGTILPALVGTALGLLAGYFGRGVEVVVLRVADLLQAFPTYILMIVLVFVLGPSVSSLIIAFTAVGWVVYARLTRGEVLRVKESDYITAATTAGLGHTRIMGLHVLPNTVRQSAVYFTSDLIFAVTALASFSFLGLGVQPPTPEWGNMIAAGQPYISVAPWLSVAPGLVLALLALGLALIGDALQSDGSR
ncbi:ABC transporter permease [Microbacterium sp. 4R-513]|uniref:ABC transporter permease n=1 Tax=Microbacterium sp. 4R-513 TaxID=2567934 RepID=UPI0013E0EB85|nr:ABC transporter permease [Microbacterium sp. 4R-513]QIG39493.1 ABC transporter permease [Microbacterium sp. 4R-513]